MGGGLGAFFFFFFLIRLKIFRRLSFITIIGRVKFVAALSNSFVMLVFY
jgi:hypothetical protein